MSVNVCNEGLFLFQAFAICAIWSTTAKQTDLLSCGFPRLRDSLVKPMDIYASPIFDMACRQFDLVADHL